jgi:hypothetical protein
MGPIHVAVHIHKETVQRYRVENGQFTHKNPPSILITNTDSPSWNNGSQQSKPPPYNAAEQVNNAITAERMAVIAPLTKRRLGSIRFIIVLFQEMVNFCFG